jgi:hypothetical protein
MNKVNLTIILSLFIFSTLISFVGASYLLNNYLAYAGLSIGFYFLSGLCLPHTKDENIHAAWLGLSIGLGIAVLKCLPSAFSGTLH